MKCLATFSFDDLADGQGDGVLAAPWPARAAADRGVAHRGSLRALRAAALTRVAAHVLSASMIQGVGEVCY
jgi:hypothetical protein